jgi:hypothetical protein
MSPRGFFARKVYPIDPAIVKPRWRKGQPGRRWHAPLGYFSR